MTQVLELEEQLSTYRADIALGNAVDRLMSNRDFKKVILDNYCGSEVLRLIGMSSNISLPEPVRLDCVASAQAGARLKEYLTYISSKARSASLGIVETEAELEYARQEEGTE